MVLPTYEACSSTEVLGRLTLTRMMAKLSTRRYSAGLEPVGAAVEATSRSVSRSAVSRRNPQPATETALGELILAVRQTGATPAGGQWFGWPPH